MTLGTYFKVTLVLLFFSETTLYRPTPCCAVSLLIVRAYRVDPSGRYPCYVWYSEVEGLSGWDDPLSSDIILLPSHLFTEPRVTAHPSGTSVPVIVLLYSGPLLCCFIVPIKGLNNYLTVTY